MIPGSRRVASAAGCSVGKSQSLKPTESTPHPDIAQDSGQTADSRILLDAFDRRIDRILLALLSRHSRSVDTLAVEADVPLRAMARLLSTVAAVAAEGHRRTGARP